MQTPYSNNYGKHLKIAVFRNIQLGRCNPDKYEKFDAVSII